jgi:hypothetical protein
MHKGLDEKKASLPKFSTGFNDQSVLAFCRNTAAL